MPGPCGDRHPGARRRDAAGPRRASRRDRGPGAPGLRRAGRQDARPRGRHRRVPRMAWRPGRHAAERPGRRGAREGCAPGRAVAGGVAHRPDRARTGRDAPHGESAGGSRWPRSTARRPASRPPCATRSPPAGCPSTVARDWRAMKWSKLLTNLVANAVPALLDESATDVYADRRLFGVERSQAREALAVMQALRLSPLRLPGADVRLLALGFRAPASIARPVIRRVVGGARGGKAPSLLLHLRAGGGPSESPWLNGGVATGGPRGGRSHAGQRDARGADGGGRRGPRGVGSHPEPAGRAPRRDHARVDHPGRRARIAGP